MVYIDYAHTNIHVHIHMVEAICLAADNWLFARQLFAWFVGVLYPGNI